MIIRKTQFDYIANQKEQAFSWDQLVMRYANSQFGFRGILCVPVRSPQTAAILHDFRLTGEEKVERVGDWIARLSRAGKAARGRA